MVFVGTRSGAWLIEAIDALKQCNVGIHKGKRKEVEKFPAKKFSCEDNTRNDYTSMITKCYNHMKYKFLKVFNHHHHMYIPNTEYAHTLPFLFGGASAAIAATLSS